MMLLLFGIQTQPQRVTSNIKSGHSDALSTCHTQPSPHRHHKRSMPPPTCITRLSPPPTSSLATCHLYTPCTPISLSPFYTTPHIALTHRTSQTNYNSNKMASATEHYSNRPSTHTTSQSRQAVKFLTAATTGASLLVLSGLVLTATVIGLVVATPLLVLFSPVLVPATVALFLTFVGFVSSGGFGLAAVAALGWIYNYVSGKHPPGADKLDYARHMIADKARDMKERAKDYGHAVQHRVHDATHQTTSS